MTNSILRFRRRITRRDFLETAAASPAFAAVPALAQDAARQLGTEESTPPVPKKDDPQIRVLLHEHDLSPLEAERSHTLTARDLANDPLPQPVSSAEGRSKEFARIQTHRCPNHSPLSRALAVRRSHQ